MRWLVGLVVGLIASFAAIAQTHPIYWPGPFVQPTFDVGFDSFTIDGYAPKRVTIVSYDVTAITDGYLREVYTGDIIPMSAGETIHFAPGLEFDTFWLYRLTYYQFPGLYEPAIFSNFYFEVSDEVYRAVPEPAVWAMLIGGFGLAGAAMRRRRTAVTFA